MTEERDRVNEGKKERQEEMEKAWKEEQHEYPEGKGKTDKDTSAQVPG